MKRQSGIPLKDVLEYEKHKVDLAEDGIAGVEMFSNEKYDVVLCDIKMAQYGWY